MVKVVDVQQVRGAQILANGANLKRAGKYEWRVPSSVEGGPAQRDTKNTKTNAGSKTP